MDWKNISGISGIITGILALLVPSITGELMYGYLIGPIAILMGLIAFKVNSSTGGLSIMLGASSIIIPIIIINASVPNMAEYNIVLAVVGYSFSLANLFIGVSRIKDLNSLKQQLGLVKMHKYFGRVEVILFMTISAICVLYPVMMLSQMNPGALWDFSTAPTVSWHNVIGGFLAFGIFLVKIIPAYHFKDAIYKHGHILGPIGFIAWSLGYWTSMINFFYFVVPSNPGFVPVIWPNIGWAVGTSVIVGLILYMYAKQYNLRLVKAPISPSTHGVALILHGISFGYESAAKELVGSPVLYKYVYPYTYKSLDKLNIFLGVDMEELDSMTLNDAIEYYMGKCAEIGMAEKIQVRFKDANTFSVESINCSTAVVRSRIPAEEIKGSICPWALLAASLVNKITGKEVEIEASEFNEIGAKTTCIIKKKED